MDFSLEERGAERCGGSGVSCPTSSSVSGVLSSLSGSGVGNLSCSCAGSEERGSGWGDGEVVWDFSVSWGEGIWWGDGDWAVGGGSCADDASLGESPCSEDASCGCVRDTSG